MAVILQQPPPQTDDVDMDFFIRLLSIVAFGVLIIGTVFLPRM